MSNIYIFDSFRANLTEIHSHPLSIHARSTSALEIGLRHDPNIWVCTPEVAKRAGMPAKWASDELQGVAAAAFRVSYEASEAKEGVDGEPEHGDPKIQGVLELYFDRQKQHLPWDKRIQAADFDGQDAAVAREPFADPLTGHALRFVSEPKAPFDSGLDPYRVIAYDREIHARYAFVRLCQRGFDFAAVHAGGLTLELGSPTQVFHQVFLPSGWTQRLIAMGEQFKR
jgi:hypothetical protein